MKPLVYLTAIAAIADGVFHLLFTDEWDTLWAAALSRFLPDVGRQYLQIPEDTRRVEGFFWIGLGAFLLWWNGAVQSAESREAFRRPGLPTGTSR